MEMYGKKIRAVVSDFDGTLIQKGKHTPSDTLPDTIRELAQRGIPFIAASGRQYYNLRLILAPVADKINYIAENGCLVVWNGKTIYKSSFTKELSHELIRDMLDIEGTDIMASGEETCYILPRNPIFTDRICNKIQYKTTFTQNFLDVEEDYIKISLHFQNDRISNHQKQWFLEKYKGKLLVVDSGDGWLDFNMIGTGKGPALQVLSEKMGIPTKEMVAFGDNENDISMLETAGLSFAMNTAFPHVKAHADHVCENVEEILRKYLL